MSVLARDAHLRVECGKRNREVEAGWFRARTSRAPARAHEEMVDDCPCKTPANAAKSYPALEEESKLTVDHRREMREEHTAPSSTIEILHAGVATFDARPAENTGSKAARKRAAPPGPRSSPPAAMDAQDVGAVVARQRDPIRRRELTRPEADPTRTSGRGPRPGGTCS